MINRSNSDTRILALKSLLEGRQKYRSSNLYNRRGERSFCVIILWAPPTRLILTASVGGIPPNPPTLNCREGEKQSCGLESGGSKPHFFKSFTVVVIQFTHSKWVRSNVVDQMAEAVRPHKRQRSPACPCPISCTVRFVPMARSKRIQRRSASQNPTKRWSWNNDQGAVGKYDRQTKRNTERNGRVFQGLDRGAQIKAVVRATIRRLNAST